MSQEEKARFEAAVQAEVEKRLADQQQQFALMMEQTIKAGLGGVDQAQIDLQAERKKLEKSQDAAAAELKKIERNAEKLLAEYLEQSRFAAIEFAKQEQIRRLTRDHLEQGRAVEDICKWLHVEREYVEKIIEVMDRRVDFRREESMKKLMKPERNARLTYQDMGRGGTIWFENDDTRFDMWWEFGTGDTLAFIDIPNKKLWESRTKLPLEQRDSILQFIAEQVAADQASGTNRYLIDDSFISILR
jgi:hypothetical protein